MCLLQHCISANANAHARSLYLMCAARSLCACLYYMDLLIHCNSSSSRIQNTRTVVATFFILLQKPKRRCLYFMSLTCDSICKHCTISRRRCRPIKAYEVIRYIDSIERARCICSNKEPSRKWCKRLIATKQHFGSNSTDFCFFSHHFFVCLQSSNRTQVWVKF